MYSIVQPHRSRDPQVCIPKQEVSTIKPKKAVGQKLCVGLNRPPQPGDKINARVCNLNRGLSENARGNEEREDSQIWHILGDEDLT